MAQKAGYLLAAWDTFKFSNIIVKLGTTLISTINVECDFRIN
jgi:hypothetical protein